MDREAIVNAVKELSVLELSQLVKDLEQEFGVSAAAPVAIASVSAAGLPGQDASAEAEEQTEFNVVLKEIGPNKINVIKAVREVTTLGLREAKDLVESAPKAVREAVNKEEAGDIKKKLEEAGAVAVLE